jgi:CRP-like cAMP-binding protein
LRHLNGAEAARVLEVGELIEMPTRYWIYGADEVIRQVFFPIDCVLSVVTRMKDGGAIEVGTIGREGTSGIPLLMGGTTTANDCYCQVPGRAIKMSADHFHRLRTGDRTFRALLDRYLQAYVNFLGQLTGCNRLHSVYQRCARWLLLTHDRVGRNEIRLTHEYLAMMLGSRRSGVTTALAALRRTHYIQYAQGCITIIDRRGLEETTCECYAVARKQFSAFLQAANGSDTAAE